MSMVRRALLLGLLAGTVASLVGISGEIPAAPREATKVELKTVTYKDWEKVLASHKGKVVVVDVWATWCTACMKKYPDFLDLNKRYADRGVVCLSLTVDEKENHAPALKFLTAKNSTLPNYRYEDKEEWQDQFKLKGLPVTYVFGRDGKLVKKFDVNEEEFTFKDVEQVVQKALAAKP